MLRFRRNNLYLFLDSNSTSTLPFLFSCRSTLVLVYRPRYKSERHEFVKRGIRCSPTNRTDRFQRWGYSTSWRIYHRLRPHQRVLKSPPNLLRNEPKHFWASRFRGSWNYRWLAFRSQVFSSVFNPALHRFIPNSSQGRHVWRAVNMAVYKMGLKCRNRVVFGLL
jgi:hypothetical protein